MSKSQFPFSHSVQADRLGDGQKKVEVTPSVDECAQIAKAYDIAGIANLKAEITLKPWRKAGVRVVGKLTGNLTQTCVVTLEEFDQKLDDTFDRAFEAVSSRPKKAKDVNDDGEIEIELESVDPPDVMIDGVIDLGAVMCEQLALNLDAFPKKPGAELPKIADDSDAEDEKAPSPFAELAKLKPGSGK